MALALLLTSLATGCGSSSKPSFCTKEAELKSSVQALGEVNPITGGTNAVTAAVNKVESSAKGLVEAAKTEFPQQTEAIDSSVSALTSSVKELSSSATRTAAIGKIPGEVSAVGASVTDFANATKSKCE